MDFFKKARYRLFIKNILQLVVMPLLSLFFFAEIIRLLFSQEKNVTYLMILPFMCIVFLIIFINTLRHINNEYNELLRQAKLLGDIESVGEMLAQINEVKRVKELVKFNEKMLFYSGFQSERIVIPSKITEISTPTNTYKGVRYYVHVLYQYEKSIVIEAYTNADAQSLCEELKRTLAPHLLTADQA